MSPRQPRVVAELGRPETPQETADRKAEASSARRAHQTSFNLVIALVASLGIVAFLVAVVVRPDGTTRDPVDYAAAAASADEAVPLVAPTIPADWYANFARITSTDGVRTWEVGFVVPAGSGGGFVGLDQGVGVDIATNPSWIAGAVNRRQPTGTATIGGVRWDVYDYRSESDTGNYAYSMSTQLDGSAVVLHGTADGAAFELVAAGITG